MRAVHEGRTYLDAMVLDRARVTIRGVDAHRAMGAIQDQIPDRQACHKARGMRAGGSLLSVPWHRAQGRREMEPVSVVDADTCVISHVPCPCPVLAPVLSSFSL